MSLTCTFGMVAVGALSYAVVCRNRWKALQGELKNAVSEAEKDKILIESMQESNANFVERISEYKHLMASGCRNLKVKEYIISSINDTSKYSIEVVGESTRNPELDFTVKMFTADNEDDREFAIREAEELIEIIKNF